MTKVPPPRPRLLPAALAAAVFATATLVAAPALAQDRETPGGHPGDLALDVGVGRGLTYVRAPTGRTASALADPLMVRAALGMSVGGGLWLEGSLRGALDPDFGAVRSTAFSAGVRIDTANGAFLSCFLRLGYSALVETRLQHGAVAGLGISLRPTATVALFFEGNLEVYPAPARERTTASGPNTDQLVLVAATSYLGGIRVAL